MKRYILLVLALGLFSCKKDKTEEPAPTVTSSDVSVRIEYNVDGQPVLFDTIFYTTPSGLPYSIMRMHYYLSNVDLIKSDSSTVRLANYFYADARDLVSVFTKADVSLGNYIGIKFNIGLDSSQNVTDGLPATVDNINMIWPDALGGGYHFLKFEGYFMSGGSSYGYAMHIGKNVNRIPVTLYKNISVSESTMTLTLKMNINEWLKNPYTYDFNIDGNYSMMNDTAMAKLSANGSDVISF